MKIKPLHDQVVVCRLDQEAKTPGGILIPETAQRKSKRAKVFAAGPGKPTEEGGVLPMSVKHGDIVLLAEWSGTELELGGEKYLIIREADILAVEE